MPANDPPMGRGLEASDPGAVRAWLYTTYVNHMERVVDRRAELSRFHLTINTLLIGTIGFVFERALKSQDAGDDQSLLIAILCLAGIGASYVWRRLINVHRQILATKFDVIHELEAALPTRPYLREYEVMRERRRRTAVSGLEIWIPILFILVYVTMFVLQVPGLIGLACESPLAGWSTVVEACRAS